MDADTALDRALAFLRKGRSVEALKIIETVLRDDRRNVRAHDCLGMALAETGDLDGAMASYRRATEIDPGYAEAHNNLGNVLRHLGRTGEAVACYQRVIDINPTAARAHDNLGRALLAANRPEEAVASLRRALELEPRLVETANNLAAALERQGETDEAIATYEAAIRINPDYAAAHNNLGNLLKGQKRVEEAIALFRHAIAIDPGLAEAHNNLGTALKALDRTDEAIASYRRAIAIRADYAEAYSNLGNALKDRGEADAALAAYQRAIDVDPNLVAAHFNRVSLMTFAPGDTALMTLKAFAGDADLPEDQRSRLLFSLGMAHDKAGLYDEAFAYFKRANDEKARLVDFDAAQHRVGTREIKRVFPERRPVADEKPDDGHRVPVFVIGMSRSGKTLVESLLARHGDVFGADESYAWTDAMRAILDRRGLSKPFPLCIEGLDDEGIREMGGTYMADIGRDAGSKRVIVNTMPANYPYVALIFQALPGARVIYCRRDPMDNCLFAYFYRYRSGNGYSYDLNRLAAYCSDFHAIMTHWQALYGERIHAVDYEDLVRSPGAVTAGIFAYCGLEIDAATVETDFTTDEIGHWRNYESHLGPLRLALDFG